MASLLGQGSSKIVLSGPEADRLQMLAGDLEDRLESMPEITEARISGRAGLNEIHVVSDARALASRIDGLHSDRALARRMGAAAADTVVDITWDATIERLLGGA